MKCSSHWLVCTLVLTAGIGSGQVLQPLATPSHFLEIRVPDALHSESVSIHYALAGQSTSVWVEPREGVSSYLIGTTVAGQPATRIKAIIYAPGCAIRTLDISLSATNNDQYSFTCEPQRTIHITGMLTPVELLDGRDVDLQVGYLARWEARFLGLDEISVSVISLSNSARLSAGGRLDLTIPDFSSVPETSGEFQIWAKANQAGILSLSWSRQILRTSGHGWAG